MDISRRLLLKMAAAAIASPALSFAKDDDKDFLRRMVQDVIVASRVDPGSSGPPGWRFKNTVGFSLITPGRETYPAFWIRDFSMAADSGLLDAATISNHIGLILRCQNGPAERKLESGAVIPPYAIPDHINFDGSAVFYPGTYSAGEDQGGDPWGILPPMDDHYEFVHLAHRLHRIGGRNALGDPTSLLDRLKKAFDCPETDPATGLATTSLHRRAVGFGFCDGIVFTGKLLVPSLLRWRAAGEMADLTGDGSYRSIQAQIARNLVDTFSDKGTGWLLAATEIGRQPDVWGTLLALYLNVLEREPKDRAVETVADAYLRGTIAYEGGVRQVPTDRDFSPTSAWERTSEQKDTYQNGAYWHTPTGWLISALARHRRSLAHSAFREYIAHLRTNDFRLNEPGRDAPWECFGRNGKNRQNGVYLASVALPYGTMP